MGTNPFKLVKFDQHDSLFLTKMAAEGLSDIRYQLEDDREGLRGECCGISDSKRQ
jgi:hypothetical protein